MKTGFPARLRAPCRAGVRAKTPTRRYRVTMGLALFLVFLNFGLMMILFLLARLGQDKETFSTHVPGLGMTWQVTLWLIITSGLVFTVLMFVGIIRPLHVIATSLNEGTPRPLEALLDQPTEMGDLARLVRQSFLQRDQLEHEIQVRRHAEAGLKLMTQDRERLIHDLHDGLIQTLYGIGLRLESLRSGSGPGTDPVPELVEVTDEINRALSNLRGSLQSSARLLQQVRSLKEALAELVVKIPSKPLVSLECPDGVDLRITPEQALELYAICSEALMNAQRHARADGIVIRLALEDSRLILMVEDDGVGMSGALEGGLGMNSMSRRAGRIGAVIRWTGNPGGGTRVYLEMPLPVPASGQQWDS